jgi:hypothetical protein
MDCSIWGVSIGRHTEYVWESSWFFVLAESLRMELALLCLGGKTLTNYGVLQWATWLTNPRPHPLAHPPAATGFCLVLSCCINWLV